MSSIKLLVLFVLCLAEFQSYISAEVHYTKLHQDGSTFTCTILSTQTLRKFKGFDSNSPDENALLVKLQDAVTLPAGEPDPNLDTKDKSKIIEIYSRKSSVLSTHIKNLCKSTKSIQPLITPLQDQPEIVKIVDGGDQANRIDVVFMGDGYTASEREQFFQDIRRLTTEMFEGATFRSYLPLFNIWAIYVPSQESGIGNNGAKNTAFRLYRESGQLRAIYTGNANYARQVCALVGTGGCEYPSLIGNDDYYGGLGGEFVISTKSNRTGTIVLRHEMGHNFADVGEEYDGGGVYSGVNSARTVASLGWGSWLSGEAREERATYRLLEYLWDDLSVRNVSLNFNSDGQYSSWYMTISVTAAGEDDSLEFLLDGVALPWTSSGSDDREFYDWYGPGFTSGPHTLTIRSKTPPTNTQIPRMVASVDLHEFGSDLEFVQDNSYISAYPTWNYLGSKSFRPSNAGCLMRNMTHNRFCPVCQEGIWSQFLRRISLIDSLDIEQGEPNAPKMVTVQTLQLGQLRDEGNQVEGERLEVTWSLEGKVVPQFQDMFNILARVGNWRVQVRLVSPEVRYDPTGLLVEEEDFVVS